jgi:hypothetical protein
MPIGMATSVFLVIATASLAQSNKSGNVGYYRCEGTTKTCHTNGECNMQESGYSELIIDFANKRLWLSGRGLNGVSTPMHWDSWSDDKIVIENESSRYSKDVRLIRIRPLMLYSYIESSSRIGSSYIENKMPCVPDGLLARTLKVQGNKLISK